MCSLPDPMRVLFLPKSIEVQKRKKINGKDLHLFKFFGRKGDGSEVLGCKWMHFCYIRLPIDMGHFKLLEGRLNRHRGHKRTVQQ